VIVIDRHIVVDHDQNLIDRRCLLYTTSKSTIQETVILTLKLT